MISREIREKALVKVLEQSAIVVVMSICLYFLWGFAVKSNEDVIDCLHEQNEILNTTVNNNTRVMEKMIERLDEFEDEK